MVETALDSVSIDVVTNPLSVMLDAEVVATDPLSVGPTGDEVDDVLVTEAVEADVLCCVSVVEVDDDTENGVDGV